MKKSMFIMVITMMIAPMVWSQSSSATLSLQEAGSPGDRAIDLTGLPAGSVIEVEVVYSGIDHIFAGSEFSFTYPAFLVLLNPNDYEDQGGLPAVWPYTVNSADVAGTTAFQQLPANASGENTGDTDSNTSGSTRKGLVFTVPAERPQTGDGDLILAKLRFVLGTGFDTDGNAQAVPSCISASETIKLFTCASGAGCQIFANEQAAALSHTFNSADLTVTLTNADANWVQLDADLSGSRDFFDALPALRCAVLGSGTSDCSLMGHPDILQILDANCDGDINFFDALPAIKKTTGNINRHEGSSGKKAVAQSLAKSGVLHVDGDASFGAASMMEFVLFGKASFGEIQLDKADQDEGWMAYGQHDAIQEVYRVFLFRTKPGNSAFPSVDVPYESEGAASISLNYVQATNSNNKEIGLKPQKFQSIEIR